MKMFCISLIIWMQYVMAHIAKHNAMQDMMHFMAFYYPILFSI